MDLWEMAEGADWRHRRQAGALAIGVAWIVRPWVRAEDMPPDFQRILAEQMGRFLPED